MIKLLKDRIAKLKDKATERSYYPLLCSFFEEYGKSGALKLQGLQATPEETSTQYENLIGFPDITIRNKNELIGWVEVKVPKENLNADKFQVQFTKYKDSLENIIFTNLREWQLWQWEEGESKKTADVLFDLTDIKPASSKEFESFLIKFFEGRAYQTRTPKQLALALAKKTRFLSKQVEEALEKSKSDSDLQKLKSTFEKTLIQDISEHQYANMVAETMAYSLFLAALEHSKNGNGTVLTLTNAIDYLPTNVPILADLYSLIKKVAGTIPTIYEATRLLVDQLNASDIDRIHQKLVEHKPGEDPVIQFYEPFLKEYDPKEREARGVYYTPKPVVDYIVKSVDWLLRNKFGKVKGLADESVHLLDPATGTGTFLMSAIQEIHANVRKENSALGDEMVKREFNKIVLSHILKHFYGFELLIAPYAIAHLKLTLEIERLGFNFALTKNDGDPDNDRFKVYLANTLDDPRPKQEVQAAATSDFGAIAFPSIPQESESAREVKKNVPILAIVGNPPYNNYGRMNRGKWILSLLKDYKKDLKEKKINLDEDSIKFIRFGQWKLDETKWGIFAMITSNTFIDGITHRQMRRSLMDTYDEIYIYNLHGRISKVESPQDERQDENVFENITQGVSINIFVKRLKKNPQTVVKYCELWGKRNDKYAMLIDTPYERTNWQELSPVSPDWYFMDKGKNLPEYHGLWKISDAIPLQNSGIQTDRDDIIFDFDKAALIEKLKKAFSGEYDSTFKRKYRIENSSSYKFADRLEAQEFDENEIVKCAYRPFDWRWAYYKIGFTSRPAYEVMQHMTRPNFALQICRQLSTNNFQHIFVSRGISERCLVSINTKELSYVHPLYLYEDSTQSSLLQDEPRKPNIAAGFADEFSKKIGMTYIQDGKGDLKKSFGPEDVFYYTYAIFHSPNYRSRYAEQLQINFPHLPLTSDKKLFTKLVHMGNGLVNLHLLGDNPFDKSETIFDEPRKWGVKIDGIKPEKLPDWQVADIRYEEKNKRVYINKGQYFEGIEKDVWEFMIGSYQVCEKWLKERKKAERALSTDDLKHYMKIVVSLRETIRIMSEIDRCIDEHGGWPIK